MSKNFLEELVEKLLLLLRRIWRKLIKLVTGRRLTPEQEAILKSLKEDDKKAILDILLEGLDNEAIVDKLLGVMERRKKKEEKEAKSHSFLFIFLLYLIIPFLFFLFIKFLLLASPLPKVSPEWLAKIIFSWSFLIWFICISLLMPILIIIGGHTILLYYKEYIQHRKKLRFATIVYLLILNIIFTYIVTGNWKFLNESYLFTAFLFLVILLLFYLVFPTNTVRKAIGTIPITIDEISFNFYKIHHNVDIISDIITNLLENIDKIELGDKLYENDIGFVLDIDNFLRLFVVFQNDCLLVTVLNENGRQLYKDGFSIKIQQKIDYVFQEILKFWELKDERIQRELMNRFSILLEGYSRPSKIGEMLMISKTQIVRSLIPIIIIAIGFVLLRYVPEGSNFEYFLVIWGTFVSLALSYFYLFKEKK